MFQHATGNDPRPHYFHQPNIMGSPPPGPPTSGTPPATSKNVGDGLFYSVLNPLLEQYNRYFSAPIEQPTMAQIGQLLAEQQTWSAAKYKPGDRLHRRQPGNRHQLGRIRDQRPLHRRHRRRFSLRRRAVRVDERADRDKHAHDPSDLAGSRESHDSEPASRAVCDPPTLRHSRRAGARPPIPRSLSSGSLPAGLTLNGATGAITGTPTAPAGSSFTIKVTDSTTPTPQSATADLSITVLPHPPTVVSAAAASSTQTTATLNATVNPNGGEVAQMRIRIRHDHRIRIHGIVRLAAGVGGEPRRGDRGYSEPVPEHHLPLQDLGNKRRRHEQRR